MPGALLMVTDIMFSRAVAVATLTVAALICAGCWSMARLVHRYKLERSADRSTG